MTIIILPELKGRDYRGTLERWRTISRALHRLQIQRIPTVHDVFIGVNILTAKVFSISNLSAK